MSRGQRWRWIFLILIAIVAGLFSAFNGGERVALDLGFTVFYRVPLVPLIFGVFLAGMTTMFLIGLRHDMRVRRALKEAGFQTGRVPPRRKAAVEPAGRVASVPPPAVQPEPEAEWPLEDPSDPAEDEAGPPPPYPP